MESWPCFTLKNREKNLKNVLINRRSRKCLPFRLRFQQNKSSFVSLRLSHPVKCLIFEIIVFLISCRSMILALYSSLVCRMWAWELLLFPLMITVCKKWTQRSRYTHLGGGEGGAFYTAWNGLSATSSFIHFFSSTLSPNPLQILIMDLRK